MFRWLLLCSALLLGHSALADVQLTDLGWSEDPAYEEEIAPFLRDPEQFPSSSAEIEKLASRRKGKDDGPGPRIFFRNGTPVKILKTEERPPLLPVSVLIAPGTDGTEIRRSSLVVKVKRGIFWETITEQVAEFLVPPECADDRCESLTLEDDFDLSEISDGTYDLVVDVSDTNNIRTVSKKRLVLASQ